MSENVNVPQWGELCKWERSYRAELFAEVWREVAISRSLRLMGITQTKIPEQRHLFRVATSWPQGVDGASCKQKGVE